MTDFDFLHGTWNVTHRRLLAVGGVDWDEFTGTSTSHGFFDGAGIFDEMTFPTKGFSGATLRTFDQESKQWFIYWVDSRTGQLGPPVIGGFQDGTGQFFGDDHLDEQPIRVRFIWSRITPTSARWEQAFSWDGERTWETNWVMEFTRA
jgi:hypothetical protein